MDHTPIFKNCIFVKKENDRYFPYRFSEKQIRYFESVSEGYGIRARCSAGISMEFETNAKELSFQFEVLSRSRHFTAFDVYENGTLVEMPRVSNGKGSGEIKFSKRFPGKSRFAVYLPFGTEICIFDFKIGDFTPIIYENKKKYLALGDSVTQGMDAVHPSLNYPSIIGRFYSMEAVSQSVGGYIFDRETIDETLSFDPDFVTIAFGTNDIGAILDDKILKQNIAAYFDKAGRVYRGKRVAAMTPIWRIDYDRDEAFRKRYGLVCELTKQEAKKQGFAVIDGFSLTPLTHDFYDDLLHPNDAGFLHYALQLLRRFDMK